VVPLDLVVLTVEHPDFYAGAIAMFAVIVFAKFVTHHVRHGSTKVFLKGGTISA
jgi:hypothetical protein